MKKYLTQIVILILLVGTIVVAQFVPFGTSRFFDMLKFGEKTTHRELREFALTDTASVDRVFMVNKENRIADLTRGENNRWMINGEYEANQYNVNLLLKTLHRMRVKNPVARSAEENITKRLATKSVKIEVYDGDEILKTYFIGGVTQDQAGTYAMLKGSKRPYVVEIPGFRGYISSRFHASELTWRSTRIFTFSEEQLNTINVQVGGKTDQSFKVKVHKRGKYDLYDANDRKAIAFDTLKVRRLVKEFNYKFFSAFVAFKTQSQVDSVYNSPLFYKYNVAINDGRNLELSLHRVNNYVPKDETEVDVLNGIINQKDWVSLQTHIFAPMFVELNDFKPRF
ncbi:MAG: DUF4340 domain-containing protein [Salinivirgaceae bacterium]